MSGPKAAQGVTRAQVLVALGAYINLHGYSPTVRELATACGINSTSCYGHLERLIADGKVTEQPGKPRTLRVVAPESETRDLSLLAEALNSIDPGEVAG